MLTQKLSVNQIFAEFSIMMRKTNYMKTNEKKTALVEFVDGNEDSSSSGNGYTNMINFIHG